MAKSIVSIREVFVDPSKDLHGAETHVARANAVEE